MSPNIALVVMAAGIGNRYGGTKQLDVFGKKQLTIAEYNMLHAMDCGFKKFVFVVSEICAEIFNQRLKRFLPSDCSFFLVHQREEKFSDEAKTRTKPWGTGHAIMCCEGIIDCNFGVANADDLYGRNAISLLAKFLSSEISSSNTFANVAYKLDGTLSKNGTVSRGIISVDNESYLKTITEQTSLDYNHSFPSNTLTSMNLWGFTPTIFKLLRRGWTNFKKNIKNYSTDEFGLSDFIGDEVKDNRCKVAIIKTNSVCCGVTYKSDKTSLEEILDSQLQ